MVKKFFENLKNALELFATPAEVVYLSKAVDRTDLRARMKRMGMGDL